MLNAFDYTRENGIPHWNDYPSDYKVRKNSECHASETKGERFYNSGGVEIDDISNEEMKRLISKGPIGVAIASDLRCMMSYQGGIIGETECKCSDPNTKEVNHAVTVVGYGKATRLEQFNGNGCSEYWLIKNSWGTYWGEGGLFKLCADRFGPTAQYGTCQINSYAMYPTLE